LAGVLALGACTVPPPAGPSVVVMPGQNKTFQQFQADDANCRNFAQARIGTTPAQAATDSAIGSAALGTALGAGIGALAGAAGGAAGTGAAAGAAAGLFMGSAAGAGASQQSYAWAQHDYDIAYAQCMAANGNQLPQATPAPGYPSYYYPPGYAWRPYRYYYPGYYPGYYPVY
jgi:hypothetical protein